MLKIRITTSRIILLWIVSICLQIAEGLWYFSMGEMNCGTQIKLSAILSGVLFVILGYMYLRAEKAPTPKVLHVLGDYSFGIFFSHLAVMLALGRLPYYVKIALFPLNAIIAVSVSLLCVFVGRKVLGKYAKHFAL